MPSQTVSGAAGAAVDSDLVGANRMGQGFTDRALTHVAYTGSAAAGDAGVEVYIGDLSIGRYYNSRTGTPNKDDDVPVGNLFWPRGAKISAVVFDAGVTNATFFRWTWVDLG